MLSRALWYTFLGKGFHVHLTINTFPLDFEDCRQNVTLFKKTPEKRSLLVHYGYRQLIAEYLISDVLKY